MEMKIKHPAPICATVSRKTGEIRIQWVDDQEMQIRFGKIMNQLSRIYESWEDGKAKEAFYAEIDKKLRTDVKTKTEATATRCQDT